MSPVVARAAVRVATRATPRRPFSVYTAIRSVGRAMEAHPFERLPVTQKSAAADWGRIVKSAGGRLAVFFPGMALILGWPSLFKLALDGKMAY